MSNPSEDRRIDLEIHRQKAGSDPFAAAMRATRMPMLITDPRQADNPIVFVNDAFARLTGYSREETLGRNCRFLQGPGTNARDIDRIRAAIHACEPIEIEILNYRKDGSVFWNRVLISPVFDRDDLTYFFASQLDVTPDRSRGLDEEQADEMKRRIADLTATEERLQFTLKAGGLGTWSLDIQRQRLLASPICKANFGIGAADTFTYEDLKSLIHPDDFPKWQDDVSTCLAGDGNFYAEYRIRRPDGRQAWIEVRAQTHYDANGVAASMSGISVDVTERKNAEAYRSLVMRELGHRIKNILALVQSIVHQSLRFDPTLAGLREIIANRIGALASAQDLLTSGQDWDIASLRETVERAIQPFNQNNRIHYFGPNIEIAHGASSALSLALHELATNAIKYGALSNDEGRVRIEWAVDGGLLRFRWLESGGPEVTPPARRGFGSRLIERALGGAAISPATVDFRASGLVFDITASIDSLREEQSG